MLIKNHDDTSGIGWLVGIGIVIMAVLAGMLFLGSKSPFEGKTNREVALICTSDMATQFHIHPHLQIVINGVQQEMPANIGIQSECMNAIHTHDASGTIHVESPEKRDFTLDDFFAVWGKSFNKNQILDYKADTTHHVKVTVNGKETQEFENTVMHDGDKIIISYEAKK